MSSYVTRKTPGDTVWFRHDRFGMFIHWGLYAMPARHEWIKHYECIPEEKYQKYFAQYRKAYETFGQWMRDTSAINLH